MAPEARNPLRGRLRLLPEGFLFGSATLAVALTGYPIVAAVFAGLVVLNRLALHALRVDTAGDRIY